MNDSAIPQLEEKEIYYYAGVRRVRLFPDPQVFAVRLQPVARLQPEKLSDEAKLLLEEAQPLTFLPRDGLNVYQSEDGLQFMAALRQQMGIDLALPAFRRVPQGGDVVFVTTRLLAQFKPEMDAELIASLLQKLGLRVLEPLAYAPNGFLLEAVPGIDGLGALEAANMLVEQGLVEFAEPDLIQSRHWKDGQLPDPAAAVYLDQQWHLKATGVLNAWRTTAGSPTIRIAILDDGLDMQHPEFSVAASSGQPKVAAQFDFATGTIDASTKTYFDNHGTPCTGVAAAAGIKAAGAAPACRLVIARTPDYLGISDEASMFQWAADNGADVISCSWGPDDGIGAAFPLPSATRLAIQYCLNYGRAGKGIPIFWAAGNGSELVSLDGYASNPNVMAIAACTADENPAPYSDFGPEIFACAPSNGGARQPAIFTSDRSGSAGYNPGSAIYGDAQGDYTDSFGGTSAAAPLAAGITALVLSANPQLTAFQVRTLLRTTADRIGSAAAYDANGHSNQFGYGRLNATQAVAAALQSAAPPPATPTILGPTSWSRTGQPPVFQVDPGPHAYYVVEMASSPELFDSANHGSERTASNFYGSWSDSPFQSNPTYMMTPATWLRLQAADRLWYRVGASTSATAYVDYIVSPPDDQGEDARSIEILPGVPSSGASRRTISDLARKFYLEGALPWIEGPLSWDRSLGPPTFRLEPDLGAAYKIEVATDAKSFDAADNTAGLPRAAFFTSDWIKRESESHGAPVPFLAYILPLKAWEALLAAPRFYYRLVIQNAKIVASPVFVMDLTGEPQQIAKEEEGLMRTEEALWRMPRNQIPLKKLRSKRGISRITEK